MNHNQITDWARQQSEIAARRGRTTDKIAATVLVIAVMLFVAAILLGE